MSKAPQAYFISGVSGVGKSSAMKSLKATLPADAFDLRDFDERGVPDGGGPAWHDAETSHWLEVAGENAKQRKSTIISGFQNPEKFKTLYDPTRHVPATLILLNASGETIRKRLLGRYPTAESVKEINRAAGMPLEQFVEQCVAFAPTLRNIFERAEAPIIETDGKTPEEIAQEIQFVVL